MVRLFGSRNALPFEEMTLKLPGLLINEFLMDESANVELPIAWPQLVQPDDQ